ncbi:guanine nucleotide-binding protein G(I)/G(S)/G(O) subunit gamma-12 isoform X1 [Sapajus apella]|uniref:Guanine nucleotide-binding protein G(I)/G(S)/G(O) subunit gamma-12 isoform X1 n=1 Tax=Sapajus apella TaxID=9515 RepID=A0A6J3JEC9_SAPAP|nr:guanine nucleotide-binding protein G(I)/G(S)/G(O) subunit gamma-12 isoform X1 [Sapajus apella]
MRIRGRRTTKDSQTSTELPQAGPRPSSSGATTRAPRPREAQPGRLGGRQGPARRKEPGAAAAPPTPARRSRRPEEREEEEERSEPSPGALRDRVPAATAGQSAGRRIHSTQNLKTVDHTKSY